MSRVRIISAALVVFVIAGCDRRQRRDLPAATIQALEAADQYELVSLQPAPGQDGSPGSLHGWRVLGRTLIADAGTRKRLNDALRAGAQAIDGVGFKCFEPRHAIRATRAGKVTDVLVCFECQNATVFTDGKQSVSEGFVTTASPQATFDAVLRAAGVPLASKPE